MLAFGFAGAPVSKALLFGLLVSTVATTATDSRQVFPIRLVQDLWIQRRWWKLFTWQTCYTNTTELLFAATTIYHMRVVERLWGSRKYASFVFLSAILTSVLTPLLTALILRPVFIGAFNFLPAGPTSLLFALLFQYCAAVPHTYKYHVETAPIIGENNEGIVFSDKSFTYLLAAQLALSQAPGSLASAMIGWLFGLAWRNRLLPSLVLDWRPPTQIRA